VIAKEVFLNDPVKAFGGDVAVPDTIGVNHEDRSLGADAEALGFGAHDGEFKFVEPRLHVIPEDLAFGEISAIRSEANEEMPLGGGNAGLGQA
jgi:hypothetical protein